MATSNATREQVIRSGELYTLAEAKLRLGVSNWAWRSFGKRLRTVRVGRRRYVTGDDILALFADPQLDGVSVLNDAK